MFSIPLSQGLATTVDKEDYERLSAYSWCAVRTSRTRIYAVRKKAGRVVRMHREILGIDDPSVLVDHKDGDGLNNQRHNLRTASYAQNSQNRGMRLATSSRFKGVTWVASANRWRAQLKKDNRLFSIGYFIDEVEAARAYDCKAIELFGEFARLNFPPV